jgi:translation initiation factor IF-3
VRLIGEDAEQLGVVPTFEALRIAQERGVDLVEVAPTAVPPVCRLMDYGRFKYEQTKREREAKKNQKVVELKEVRMTPRTDEHDIIAKVKSILRFLGEGDKVKVTIRFRGRELGHPQLGRQILDEVAANIKDGAVIERPPIMEGRQMFMIMAPPGSRVAAPPRPMQQPQGQPVGAGMAPRPPGPIPNNPGGPRPQGAPPMGPPRPPGAGPAPMGPRPSGPGPAPMGPRPPGPSGGMPVGPRPAGPPGPGPAAPRPDGATGGAPRPAAPAGAPPASPQPAAPTGAPRPGPQPAAPAGAPQAGPRPAAPPQGAPRPVAPPPAPPPPQQRPA